MYCSYWKSLKYFNWVWEVSGDDREFELWFRIWKWLSLACHMKSHAGSPSIWRAASGSITQMSRPEALLVNSFKFNSSELVPSSWNFPIEVAFYTSVIGRKNGGHRSLQSWVPSAQPPLHVYKNTVFRVPYLRFLTISYINYIYETMRWLEM